MSTRVPIYDREGNLVGYGQVKTETAEDGETTTETGIVLEGVLDPEFVGPLMGKATMSYTEEGEDGTVNVVETINRDVIQRTIDELP